MSNLVPFITETYDSVGITCILKSEIFKLLIARIKHYSTSDYKTVKKFKLCERESVLNTCPH